MPWSAPVFDGRATAVDPAIYCMSAGRVLMRLALAKALHASALQSKERHTVSMKRYVFILRVMVRCSRWRAFGVWFRYCRKFGGDGEHWGG
jgi:hypothetical protein